MSLYKYNKSNPHPATDKSMIRVATSVDGEYKQKYFDPSQHKEAKEYDAKCRRDRDRIDRRRRQLVRKPQSPHQTGLPGLRMTVSAPANSRDTKWRVFFEMQYRIKGRPRVFKRRMVTRSNIDDAWDFILKELATARGFKWVPPEWNNAKPSVRRINKMIQHYCQTNPKCPLDRLPE